MIAPVSHWLGTATHLTPLRYGVEVSESHPERFSFRTTLSGSAWAYDTSRAGGTRPRSWTADFSLLDADDLAVLAEFDQGHWGPGPFVFVPAAATVSNVLTPVQASLYGAAANDGVGMTGPDGLWRPASVAGNYSVTTPAVPGLPVSAAADVSGAGASLTITLRNASGASVATASSDPDSGTGPRRLTVSVPAHNTAVSATLSVSATRSSRHQVAWTSSAPERYAPGQSASSVVVQSVSSAARGIYAGSPYYGGSITIQEV